MNLQKIKEKLNSKKAIGVILAGTIGVITVLALAATIPLNDGDYNSELSKHSWDQKLDILHGNKLIFSYLYDNGSKIINANSLIYRIILVNAEWAARLVLYDDINTQNGMLMSWEQTVIISKN